MLHIDTITKMQVNKSSQTQQTFRALAAHGATAATSTSNGLLRLTAIAIAAPLTSQSPRRPRANGEAGVLNDPPHHLTYSQVSGYKAANNTPKVFWQSKLSRLLEDKKVAFEIIKPRFLFSCRPNVINRKQPQHEAKTSAALLSEQSCSCLPTFEELVLGLRVSHSVFLGPPVTCSGGVLGLMH